MNFKEWSDKYYPNESEKILHKMSHAWTAAHVNVLFSKVAPDINEPHNTQLQTDNSRFVPPDNYMCCSCGKIHNYRIEAEGCCR